jgi:primosomal protein N' (replication factor Y)
VAVPVPGLGLLSYAVRGRSSAPPKGARVTVPLGNRTVTGCVVDPAAVPPADAVLRDVVAVVDDEPFLPETVVDLALWVGDYYASGPGDALAIAMPPAARRGERTSFRTVHIVSRTALIVADGSSVVKGDRQRQAIAALDARAEGLTAPELLQRGIGRETVRSLLRLGLVTIRESIVMRDPFHGDGRDGGGPWTLEGRSAPVAALTDEQTLALGELDEAASAGTFRAMLLHGVTGSGKTEVYLRLAHRVIARGRRVLVLVPEIALTPAAARLFRDRFGDRVAIQHSGLSDGERHDQWHRIRRGAVDIVVGTRSAVFAPIGSLGLIIVDEEHESSYKQDEAPRYHGRDVAVMRGRMEHALVVLGTATPSLESAANVERGRYGVVRLTRRVMDRPLASVRIVDMRAEFAAHGPDVIISAPLATAIGERLSRHEQTVVLLNRRGFATVVFCRQCATSLECPHCSVTLTYHRAARRVRCHYCDYASGIPKACTTCGGEYLEQSGFGTERLEAEIRLRFPEARVTRVDRDTVRRRGAISKVLNEVNRGVIDVLVGTQMIAKGHDFPAVTLVGVISADVGLGMADFRAAERTFQLLTQVVGRAGRGAVPGEAIVQTLYPDHYAVRAAGAQDYDAFYAREIEFRRALRYPPMTALINVVVRGRTLTAAMTDAADLVRGVRERGPGAVVLGPAPAAMSKIKDEFRAQFFLKGSGRHAMRQALTAALDARPDLKRKTMIDVDPVSVM